MKFFYINNSLCEGCDECSVACPVGAIYSRGGKHYIDHGKCNSCGGCIRTCGHNAVSIEGVDGMVERMENADLYLSRIRRLEKELAHVNDRLEGGLADLNAVLEASPVAMAVCSASGRVEAANSRFRQLAEGGTLYGSGEDGIAALVSEGTARMILAGAASGEAGVTSVNLKGRPFTVRAVALSGNGVLCVFDDLSDGRIASARIAESLRRAVDRKMEMVRQIGTILGDEASQTLNDINTALGLIEYSEKGGGDYPAGGTGSLSDQRGNETTVGPDNTGAGAETSGGTGLLGLPLDAGRGKNTLSGEPASPFTGEPETPHAGELSDSPKGFGKA